MEEVETLKRDKNVLMMELVHLRQKQSVRPEPAAMSPTRTFSYGSFSYDFESTARAIHL